MTSFLTRAALLVCLFTSYPAFSYSFLYGGSCLDATYVANTYGGDAGTWQSAATAQNLTCTPCADGSLAKPGEFCPLGNCPDGTQMAYDGDQCLDHQVSPPPSGIGNCPDGTPKPYAGYVCPNPTAPQFCTSPDYWSVSQNSCITPECAQAGTCTVGDCTDPTKQYCSPKAACISVNTPCSDGVDTPPVTPPLTPAEQAAADAAAAEAAAAQAAANAAAEAAALAAKKTKAAADATAADQKQATADAKTAEAASATAANAAAQLAYSVAASAAAANPTDVALATAKQAAMDAANAAAAAEVASSDAAAAARAEANAAALKSNTSALDANTAQDKSNTDKLKKLDDDLTDTSGIGQYLDPTAKVNAAGTEAEAALNNNANADNSFFPSMLSINTDVSCQSIHLQYKDFVNYTLNPCDKLLVFRQMLGWLLYILTVIAIYRIAVNNKE